MSKEEMITLKEEFLKEIRDLEKRINLQVTLKLKEFTEKNDKFIQEFRQISKNNKSLTDLISSKNLESHKIDELELFKKKSEPMITAHDIRINTTIKELNDLKFKYAKEISENLTVPGFVGQACKYKNISNYIAVNISDMEKVKNENESNKKETKEIKRKMEDMIKTTLNLVDKSNEKSIEYINNKMRQSEEIINNKFGEINDKMFQFKAVLLTQDKIDDFKKKILDEVNDNNYNKTEIDKMMNNIIKSIEMNLDNLKNDFKYEMNKTIKSRMEKYENAIKDLNRAIRDTNMKIIKSNQFQSKLFKEFLDFKSTSNKNNFSPYKNDEEKILEFNFGVKSNIFGNMRNKNKPKTNLAKSTKVEEEKTGKNKIIQSFEKNKTLDSMGEIRYKSSKKVVKKDLKTYIKEKEKEKEKNNNIIKNKIDFNENIKNEFLNNDSSFQNDKEKNNYYLNNNESKLNISMDNKNNDSYNTINDVVEEALNLNENIKENQKNLFSSEKKVKFKMEHNPNSNEIQFNSYPTASQKEKNNHKMSKEKEKEIIIDHNTILSTISLSNSNNKKDKQKLVKKNQKIDFSNIISYGMNNQNKIEIVPIEKNTKKEEPNSILNIFQEKNSSIKASINNINDINKTIKNKTGGYSLHKLAEINAEEKIAETLPSFPSLLSNTIGKISNKTSNLVKPIRNRNSPLYQSYDSKLGNKKSNTHNNFNNKKIASAFGRTSYHVYNKKQEGVQNLINKRINSNYNKRYKNKKGDFNLELSPVAKIKIYDK